MKQKNHIVGYLLLTAAIVIGLSILYMQAKKQEESIINTSLIGAERTQVLALVNRNDIATFDYPSGHPLRGRTIIVVTDSDDKSSSPNVYVRFVFDIKGDQGKLISYEVTDQPSW